jgi:hypothetical protein
LESVAEIREPRASVSNAAARRHDHGAETRMRRWGD